MVIFSSVDSLTADAAVDERAEPHLVDGTIDMMGDEAKASLHWAVRNRLRSAASVDIIDYYCNCFVLDFMLVVVGCCVYVVCTVSLNGLLVACFCLVLQISCV